MAEPSVELTEISSRTNNSPGEEVQHQSPEDLSFNSITNLSTEPMIRMPQVPQVLRENPSFNKFYMPTVVSIGPYHHGKPSLKHMESIKPQIANRFFHGSRPEQGDPFEELVTRAEELRRYYAPSGLGTTVNGNRHFAKMMLLDGCFLLYFIKFICNDQKQSIDTYNVNRVIRRYRAFIQQDLLLLENQIPLEVLEILSKYQPNSSKCLGLSEMLKKYVVDHSNIVTRNNGCWGNKDLKPAHLLQLLREWLVRPPSAKEIIDFHGRRSSRARLENCGEYLLSRLRRPKQDNYYFRNVMELKKRGIHMKAGEKGSGGVTDISYRSRFIRGYLELPPITVDDSTGPKLMNLIAYEMCPEHETRCEVASFVWFLESLIDGPEDVRELRSARVIQNLLGSDEEVARLFNEVATDLVPDQERYSTLKMKMQERCESSVAGWMAELLHVHFSSPWTIAAFVGALAALGMAALQLTYQIKGYNSEQCDSLCEYLKESIIRP